MREIAIQISINDKDIVKLSMYVSEEIASKMEQSQDIRLRVYVKPKDQDNESE
jgi:hypothetical protein